MIDPPDEIDETLPEVVKRFLKMGAKLHRIHLDANGKWTHEGLDFENSRVIDLFSRSIGRTEGGTWVLEIGRYTYPIQVEDTGYFVERVDLATAPPRLALSDGTTEELDPDSLQYSDGGRLYCRIKDGRFRARFKRNAYYSLAETISEADGTFVAEFGGKSHPIELV